MTGRAELEATLRAGGPAAVDALPEPTLRWAFAQLRSLGPSGSQGCLLTLYERLDAALPRRQAAVAQVALPGHEADHRHGTVRRLGLDKLGQLADELEAEAFAAGLPVVSTAVPEVQRYAHACTVAGTPDEFLAGIERALSQNDPAARGARSEAMKSETWAARVAEVARVIDQIAVNKRGATARD